MSTPWRSVVERGLDFLTGEQLASGRFRMEFSMSGHGTVPGERTLQPDNSPFSSSFIAHSLGYCSDSRATAMIGRAVDFLSREEGPPGLWRYWSKDAPLYRQVPPDTDDTACISALLRARGRPAPRNADLLLANRNAKGLFYTWMVPRFTLRASVRWWMTVLEDITYGRLVGFWKAGASRGDVDSVVNANVVHYLGERRETEPVIEWLLGISRKETEAASDRWYRSVAAFYYALSRCYAGGIRSVGAVKPRVLQYMSTADHRNGVAEQDVLQAALIACAAINFDLPRDAYAATLDYLVREQHADGGWGWYPFYFDGRPVPVLSWGSRAITTAFCVEALTRAAQRQASHR